MTGPFALCDLRARALERFLEARLIERLEQEVERVDLERANRVSVVRRDEDDRRQARRIEILDDLEAVHARHLHVEEDEVGLRALDRLDGARSVGADGDDLDVGLHLEERLDAVASKLFVVHDHGANLCRFGGSHQSAAARS